MTVSNGYYVQQASMVDDLVGYHVMNFQSGSSAKSRVLTHDKLADYISCSCSKFEFEGIPCRHMLAFFRINQVSLLPDKYILNRWTRNAKVGAIYDFGAQTSIDTPDAKLMARHFRLSYKASVVIDVASLTDEGTNMLNDQFDCIYSKLQDLNISSKNDNQSQRNQSIDGEPSIVDPSLVRSKGCGKRLKSSKETTTSKARLCRRCGHRGVSHDKRNCPLLQQRSNVTEKDNTNDDESYEEDLASIAVISHSSCYNALQTKGILMQHHISLFSAPLSNMIYNYKQV
ncbi:protein FAR-RED ELONGATED HYPOCOTYL 3-like [Zingiber officinale]|uniref:protein FAR-RED ELONGATED HYPOCOTYL 3-like n=1 Tax=Zingiber officinale TaxID=94328 RepID=UPI001C4B3574|nr:protein FAR-RED ELONGATED HYPOCOTYL 3-like [Zingiber officinale]